jgi:hypothetical protein
MSVASAKPTVTMRSTVKGPSLIRHKHGNDARASMSTGLPRLATRKLYFLYHTTQLRESREK